MSELSDYKRYVEEPMKARHEMQLKNCHAEIERLRAEVVKLAQLGDFSGLRPDSETLKLVIRLKRAGKYTDQQNGDASK